MIIYAKKISAFLEDINNSYIEDILEEHLKSISKTGVSKSEKVSWEKSLNALAQILNGSKIAEDTYILLELKLPSSPKRIDATLLGKDKSGSDNAVLIELKQWEQANKTDEDGVVSTFLGKRERDTVHPSYQVYSYMRYLQSFHGAFHDNKNIKMSSVVYLHNFRKENASDLTHVFYQSYIKKAPLFFRGDSQALRSFFENHVGFGEGEEILNKIQTARIFPSKKLAETIDSLLQGNKEFTLLDEQKIAFEKVKTIFTKSTKNKQKAKNVILIKGGAGTGKSLIGINLLQYFLSSQTYVQYVTPNQSFREVLRKKVKPQKDYPEVDSLFKGSSVYINANPNEVDVLICDEAHRLKEYGFRQKKVDGENQITQLINASKTSIFFVDDDQLISRKDIGEYHLIKEEAIKLGATITELELNTQFRCNGSDNYIDWLDDIFKNRHRKIKKENDYDFQIVDDPNLLVEKVVNEKNGRIVAGYAWKWNKEKKDGHLLNDVTIPEYDFKLPWNDSKRLDWAIHPECRYQVGCIHTAQGLEFDTIGVIIGEDLSYDPVTKKLTINREKYMDVGSKPAKPKSGEIDLLEKQIINTYKTLLTRGMKSCYVYCCDKHLQDYLKDALEGIPSN